MKWKNLPSSFTFFWIKLWAPAMVYNIQIAWQCLSWKKWNLKGCARRERGEFIRCNLMERKDKDKTNAQKMEPKHFFLFGYNLTLLRNRSYKITENLLPKLNFYLKPCNIHWLQNIEIEHNRKWKLHTSSIGNPECILCFGVIMMSASLKFRCRFYTNIFTAIHKVLAVNGFRSAIKLKNTFYLCELLHISLDLYTD